jgi:hypothetical protein
MHGADLTLVTQVLSCGHGHDDRIAETVFGAATVREAGVLDACGFNAEPE